MNQTKLSSRIYALVKSALAAVAVVLFMVYVMIAKPDYRIMNMAAHVVVPVAHGIGDLITWPVRVAVRATRDVRELVNMRGENEELRVRLDAALARQHEYEIAILENQKLAQELDLVQSRPQRSIIADITGNGAALHHDVLTINRGTADGISNGMVVVSMDGRLVGVVSDAGGRYSRVRTLRDANTNIAVRVAGTEVYGFLRGNGVGAPEIGFFSDPQFQPAPGIRLVTSNISGVLPGGIYVGTLHNESDVDILSPSQISRVMVLDFDSDGKYGQ